MSVNSSYWVSPTLGEHTVPSLKILTVWVKLQITLIGQMSSVISSVRHSPNEFLRIFSFICFFTLMIYSGHYCFALHLVCGTGALLAARHKQIYNPLRRPAILECQVARCNFTGYKHIPKHIHRSWETTTVCQRSPVIQTPVDVIICNHSFSARGQNIPLDLKSRDCYSGDPVPNVQCSPRSPSAAPWVVNSAVGNASRSQPSCAPAALVQRLVFVWRIPRYLPAGPCFCTQGGGSPSPSREAAECGWDNWSRAAPGSRAGIKPSACSFSSTESRFVIISNYLTGLGISTPTPLLFGHKMFNYRDEESFIIFSLLPFKGEELQKCNKPNFLAAKINLKAV